ncbi:TPA: cell envelope integrity protein TolA [Bacillus pseudomycoides]|nr:cell envelope integrity protein TolA [Bacillus pseudomycoides]
MKFTSKIIGFRSGKKRNKIIASIAYVLFFLVLITEISTGPTLWDSFVHTLAWILLFLLVLVPIANIFLVRNRLFFFNRKSFIGKIFGVFSYVILALIVYSIVGFGMESATAKETRAEQVAETKAKQEAEAKAKAKQETEAKAKAKQEAEAKAKQETETKAKQEAEAKAKQEAEAKAKQEAEAKAKQEAEAKAKQEAEAKAKQEEEAKAKQEAEAKAKQEAEAKAQQEAQAKAQQEEQKKQQASSNSVNTNGKCEIKGNINTKTHEKIYHLPGDAYYNRTKVDERKGEKWFCTEQDAINAGFRRSDK